MLACHGVHRFTHLLGKKDELVPDRAEVARVQQVLIGLVDHHLPFASRGPERIDLEAVRSGSDRRFARDNLQSVVEKPRARDVRLAA